MCWHLTHVATPQAPRYTVLFFRRALLVARPRGRGFTTLLQRAIGIAIHPCAYLFVCEANQLLLYRTKAWLRVARYLSRVCGGREARHLKRPVRARLLAKSGVLTGAQHVGACTRSRHHTAVNGHTQWSTCRTGVAILRRPLGGGRAVHCPRIPEDRVASPGLHKVRPPRLEQDGVVGRQHEELLVVSRRARGRVYPLGQLVVTLPRPRDHHKRSSGFVLIIQGCKRLNGLQPRPRFTILICVKPADRAATPFQMAMVARRRTLERGDEILGIPEVRKK